MLDPRHADGVIVLGDLKNDETSLPELLSPNRTAVALCRGQSPARLPTINVDNAAGIQLLWDHLEKLGHRRFGYIDGGWLGDIRERREVFEHLLRTNRLFGTVEIEANNPDGGYRAMRRLLNQSPRPTAVFAADDVMAFGALQAALDLGLQVPADVSLVGFDDIEMARFVRPRLTTIRQPIEEMSRLTLDWINAMIQQKSDPFEDRSIRVKPELIIRDSTGPAAA